MRRRMRSRRLSTSFCARETMAAGPSKQFDALAIERLRGPGRIKVFVSGIGFARLNRFSWKFASPEAGFAIKENASVIVFTFAALVSWSISLDACFSLASISLAAQVWWHRWRQGVDFKEKIVR